ncbi:hypothetical protein OS493_018511 [Desmophyllum pertusum]|uniref:Uncharacterized protein n=1 Tax=Desmophyllum pertusum TaxID=174260 RepID=A0A9X0A4I3_9CNID|nr:hypothetical protein OS493_018511 [Desmophyllum pertusum]
METRSTLENLEDRVIRLESRPVPSAPSSAAGVIRSTNSSFSSSSSVPTADLPTLNVLTPSSRDKVSTVLDKTRERHKAALKMLAVKFTKDELSTANCTGSQGKVKLDTTRLALIKRKCEY